MSIICVIFQNALVDFKFSYYLYKFFRKTHYFKIFFFSLLRYIEIPIIFKLDDFFFFTVLIICYPLPNFFKLYHFLSFYFLSVIPFSATSIIFFAMSNHFLVLCEICFILHVFLQFSFSILSSCLLNSFYH